MKTQLKTPIKASKIASGLGLQLIGDDIDIVEIAPLNALTANALTFSKKSQPIHSEKPYLVIGPESLAGENCAVLASQNPRLDFTKALIFLNDHIGFMRCDTPPSIDPTVSIGNNVSIGNGVTIGKGTIIYHNVVIADGVAIGENCVIKSGAVIGEEGFGFERDEEGTPLRMLHFGGVTIGNRVEIGSLTTVCRGTMSQTLIEDDVKIDDQVHIAHNCIIRKKVLIVGTASICGGVEVKEGAWVSPNSTILQKQTIGEKAFVGLGAVVMSPVSANACMVGNPAKRFEVKREG